MPRRRARAWITPVTGAGRVHLAWFCWGTAHFAAVVSSWAREAYRRGRSVFVVGPAAYAQSLGAGEMPGAAGEACWRWIGASFLASSPAPSTCGPDRALLVVVATGPLGETGGAAGGFRPPAVGVAGVQRLETEVTRWVERGGGVAVCVYDLERLQALCPEDRLELTGWALSHGALTTAAGRVVPTKGLGAAT